VVLLSWFEYPANELVVRILIEGLQVLSYESAHRANRLLTWGRKIDDGRLVVVVAPHHVPGAVGHVEVEGMLPVFQRTPPFVASLYREKRGS
jgi:hypothetical protein